MGPGSLVLDIIRIIIVRGWVIWAPIIAGVVLWHLWIRYIQAIFINDMDWVLLEIKVPREVNKSPSAMEMVLHAIHQTGGTGSWYKRLWKGAVRDWFSLEIISVEGNIYFFLRTITKYKDLIESYIYSQYPAAEINEVDDYTRYVPVYLRENDWSMYGAEMELTNDDPYPIKTYIDYGMDKELSLDEEQRIDPLTPMLEAMGSLRQGEQIWYQILVRAGAKRYKKPGTWFKKRDWVDETKDIIQEYINKNAAKRNDEGKVIKDADGNAVRDMSNMTPLAKQTLEALERSTTKFGFDVGIRALYLGKGDAFRPSNLGILLGVCKQCSSPHYNGFKPGYTTDYDYPWQDLQGRREETNNEKIFHAYITRSYFYRPYKREPFILTTEELATIFHFPGRVATTASFERIESTKSEPPANLPM